MYSLFALSLSPIFLKHINLYPVNIKSWRFKPELIYHMALLETNAN